MSASSVETKEGDHKFARIEHDLSCKHPDREPKNTEQEFELKYLIASTWRENICLVGSRSKNWRIVRSQEHCSRRMLCPTPFRDLWEETLQCSVSCVFAVLESMGLRVNKGNV